MRKKYTTAPISPNSVIISKYPQSNCGVVICVLLMGLVNVMVEPRPDPRSGWVSNFWKIGSRSAVRV